jgi:hypothetical protein
VKATQPGNAEYAPARPVVRHFFGPHGIEFQAEDSYAVPATLTLPLTTTAGLPVTWSLNGDVPPGVSLNGNVVTALETGNVQLTGRSDGNAYNGPVNNSWLLRFVPGTATDADGDGINDILEAALQHTPNQFDGPPLSAEPDAGGGVKAVLGSQPVDLKGWTIVIETSADLQTWSAVPAASLTKTPNAGGTTERVVATLPHGPKVQYARLKAVKP